MRKISVLREHNALLQDVIFDVYTDGEKTASIRDGETVCLVLSDGDHLLQCKTQEETFQYLRTYLLHVPCGKDNYDFLLRINGNDIELL